MGVYNHYYFDAGGHEFEAGIIDIVSAFARRAWGDRAVKFSTGRQDRYEGTDIFVLGIPIDITLAFAAKNMTRKLSGLEYNGVTLDFGIRVGNGKAKFKTPVLVIGAETAIGITKSNMWAVLDTIKSHIQEILDTGMDQYLLATDA